MSVCVIERLRKKFYSKKALSVRVEVSSVESRETTAATVSSDLARLHNVGDAVTRRLPIT